MTKNMNFEHPYEKYAEILEEVLEEVRNLGCSFILLIKQKRRKCQPSIWIINLVSFDSIKICSFQIHVHFIVNIVMCNVPQFIIA